MKEKTHFTVQLDDGYHLSELLRGGTVTIETDSFVASINPPEEIDDGDLREILVAAFDLKGEE